MGYRLAPGLSFCSADARRIFLDTARDRYLCLPAALDMTFSRWLEGDARTPADAVNLRRLADQGLLAEQPGPDHPPSPCPAVAPARTSLFDRAEGVTALDALGAYARFRWARLRLTHRGLAASLNAVELRKHRMARSGEDEASMRAVANAFRRAAAFATTRDHCLPHALAVADALCARGVAGMLVIAVRTGPFGAHAWVQVGDAIVNDSVDNVRDFTPIRLV